MAEIEQWDVYYLSLTHHTHPPKPKFIVVATAKPEIYGFFINSRINEFIQSRPHLLQCEVALTARENPYLKHNSFLDCSQVYPFYLNELTDFRGKLATTSINQTILAVQNCPALKGYYKKLILG